MKKIKKILCLCFALFALCLPLLFIGCKTSDKKEEQPNADVYAIYQLAQANGYTGTYDEWLASIKGKDGATGPQGEKGEDGKEVELQVDGTWLQWKYVDEEIWKNLFDLSELPVEGEDKKAYIEVSGVANDYFVGDEFPYNNALIKYFESEESTEFSAYRVTEENIVGFSTEKVGTFQATILCQGLHCEFEYNVYDMEAIVDKIIEESISAGIVNREYYSGENTTPDNKAIISDNEFYNYNEFYDDVNSKHYTVQDWVVRENDVLYRYEMTTEDQTMHSYLKTQVGTHADDMYEDLLNVTNFLEWFWNSIKTQGIYQYNIIDADFVTGNFEFGHVDGEISSVFKVENWKLVQLQNTDVETGNVVFNTIFSYDLDTQMPEIPDADWTTE